MAKVIENILTIKVECAPGGGHMRYSNYYYLRDFSVQRRRELCSLAETTYIVRVGDYVNFPLTLCHLTRLNLRFGNVPILHGEMSTQTESGHP